MQQRARYRPAPAILPYDRAWLGRDILAGLAAGAVVIPQAMAYATVAGMPPQFGLYTCMVPLVVYAFVGGSRTASVTTTSTIATLTASTMLGAGIVAGSPDAASELVTLTLLVGVLLLAARVLRLGAVVENISQATLTGIKVGVGLTVAVSQLPKLLGLAPELAGEGFVRSVTAVLGHLGDTHLPTALLAGGSIVLLLVITRLLPSLPGPLIVVALGIGLMTATGLRDSAIELIPQVPQGIPMPGLPGVEHVGKLLPGALAIALMAFLETVAVARAARRPDEPAIDADRELAASGLSAVLGSFFHVLPPAGGFSQTSVNARSGARTQVSGLTTAVLALLVALLLAPVLSAMPQATLGVLVFVATIGLIDIAALRGLFRYDKVEFATAAAVAVCALTAGLLVAVAVGVALTLYLVLREVNHAHVVRLVRGSDAWHAPADDAPCAGPVVLRFEMGLYTGNLRANTDAVRAAVTAAGNPAVVVLDLGRLPTMSTTVLDGLRELDTDLGRGGVSLRYANLAAPARAKAGRWPWWAEVVANGQYFDSVDGAVAASGTG